MSENQTIFTKKDFGTGVDVTFKAHVGPVNEKASVVHYQGVTGNDIMAKERPGDRVQACYLGGPAPTLHCNPDKDGRGRLYRVYDYRQRAQYWGMNSEHDCDGA